MIIISVFILITLIGLIMIRLGADIADSDLISLLALVFSFSGSTLLILGLMAMFLFRQSDQALIQRYTDLKEKYHQGDTDPEHRTAIYGKVIDMNGFIREVQFSARSPLTNWFHDSDILDLKPIQ